tara:strand:- start:1590 stop:1730 length:141 start_codon:yes stop_codon:yes gene_type:complete
MIANRCLKCGGNLFEMSKEMVGNENLMCKECCKTYSKEELNGRCCD